MAVFLSDALMSSQSSGRGFLGLGAIKDFIRNSKNYSGDGSDPVEAGALLMLSTRVQQTWLVATPRRLYCLLDDLRQPRPTVSWSMPRAALVKHDGTLALALVEHPNSERTGLIDFGERHKRWLFSRSLFTSRPVTEEIGDFIRKHMARADERAIAAAE
jgi:hypothetical protein